MDEVPETRTLATYRLERKWTIAQLAAAMARTGYGVPWRTLASLVADPTIQPRPLTLYAIQKFLALEREAGRLPVAPPEAKSA